MDDDLSDEAEPLVLRGFIPYPLIYSASFNE